MNRILLGLMVAFFLVGDAAMFAGVRFHGLFAGLVLGMIATQITLFAVFTALAPVSVFLRVTVGMAGTIVVCLGIFRMEGPSGSERVAIAAATFLQWIAVQMPLWVFRVRSGWFLRRAAGETSAFRRQDLQFGIRQLIAWTTVVAVLLSLAKTLIAADSSGRYDSKEMVLVPALLVVFNSLAAWPMIWTAFVRSKVLLWWGVAVGCSTILCVSEALAFGSIFGGVNVEVFLAMHLIQLVAVGGSLLLIRLSGVRLVRTGDHSAAADNAVDVAGNSG